MRCVETSCVKTMHFKMCWLQHWSRSPDPSLTHLCVCVCAEGQQGFTGQHLLHHGRGSLQGPLGKQVSSPAAITTNMTLLNNSVVDYELIQIADKGSDADPLSVSVKALPAIRDVSSVLTVPLFITWKRECARKYCCLVQNQIKNYDNHTTETVWLTKRFGERFTFHGSLILNKSQCHKAWESWSMSNPTDCISPVVSFWSWRDWFKCLNQLF